MIASNPFQSSQLLPISIPLGFMGNFSSTIVSQSHSIKRVIGKMEKTHDFIILGNWVRPMNTSFGTRKLQFMPLLVSTTVEETESSEGKPIFKWVEIGRDVTEAQKQAISQLSPKMEKRCKALMRQLICFNPSKGSLSDLLAAWVRLMKPRRADWLAILKELKTRDHPLYLEAAELALLEDSFEANVRDYTKIIHGYGKQNQLKDAEKILLVMKERGFLCDQVTFTAFIDMYSKAGKLKLAEETFEEIKLLGQPLDKRSYGSMIMAYVRAGMPKKGELLLREMDDQEIYAGSEIYKALLRAYSMSGDAKGAQRVFDATQCAGISPDVKLCGLLINAYQASGESEKARIAFENMRKAGLEPSDKCIALVLSAYEKENKIQTALGFLLDLEADDIMVGKEASETLAGWFKKLGVVKEVDLLLREYAAKKEAQSDFKTQREMEVGKHGRLELISPMVESCAGEGVHGPMLEDHLHHRTH